MSLGNPDDNEKGEQVQDDGSVDQKIKNRIISARNRVDEDEQYLYVHVPADRRAHLNGIDRHNAWATSVRQYIRAIRPLLTSDRIERSTFYYHEVPLGVVEVVPPDKGGIEWSKFAQDDADEFKLKRSMGLPPNFDPPEAKEAKFTGLKDVLDRRGIHLTWSIDKKPGYASFQDKSQVRLEVSRPIPKWVLEESVSRADEFLQQAGVGLEIGSDDPHGKT